jgi:hypothetical protein
MHNVFEFELCEQLKQQSEYSPSEPEYHIADAETAQCQTNRTVGRTSEFFVF